MNKIDNIAILMDNYSLYEKFCTNKKKDGFTGEITCIFPNILKKTLAKSKICRNLYFTDIGFYPKALYHTRERKNGCDEYIFIYNINGEGWFTIDNKIFNVKPNQFFILPKNTAHSYGSNIDNPWSIYWIHFTGELANEYFQFLSNGHLIYPKIVIPSSHRNQLFDRIIQHASIINNMDSVIYANNCLNSYLLSFKKEIFSKKDNDSHRSKILNDCINLMKENLDKNLNLFEISQLMNSSVSYISSIFKEKMHDSPYNHFIFLKIQHACSLLWNTTKKIKQIAEELGYEDPYHFSRVFKRVMGLSPRDFRNRNT